MGFSVLPGLKIEYFLSHFREVFHYNLFTYFLKPLFFLFFLDPYTLNVGAFNVREVSETVLNSFHSFFFILLCGSYFHYCSSRSLIRSPASVILLSIPSRKIGISFIVLFLIVCLFFSSSRSLLNVSLFSPFYFQDFGSSLVSLL